MTFSGHFAVTAITLHFTRDPYILIPLNVALHFVTDMLPHLEWRRRRDITSRSGTLMALDTAAMLGLLVVLGMRDPSWVTAAALLAGIAPDILDAPLSRLSPAYRRFHHHIHRFPFRKSDPHDWSVTLTGRTPDVVKGAIQAFLILVGFAIALG